MIEVFQKIIVGDSPVFLLICGPNGAGKSTFRKKHLEVISFPCVDPDAVAFEIFGRHPETKAEAIKATKTATNRVRRQFREKKSIALETVFSDTKGHKIALLDEAKRAGFMTVLIFIGLDHPQISFARVQDRVEHGGHDVPDEIIENRFPKCFANLKTALKTTDLCILIDNSGELRHNIFGIIEKGKLIQLLKPAPNWFRIYNIADALSLKP
ncbi:MAG: AAA family ATPase [Methylomonas sp.]|jgi:predicted ABC-type ATPase